MKIVSSLVSAFLGLFLSFFLGNGSQAQTLHKGDESIRFEQELQSDESSILGGLLTEGTVDEAKIKSYSTHLKEFLSNDEAISKRVQQFETILKAGLIYQSREEIITEDHLKDPFILAPDASPDAQEVYRSELERAIEASPQLPMIQQRVDQLSSQIRNQAYAISLPGSEASSPKLKGEFYVMWGYNRTLFGKTDSTFKTSEGTFTIHNTVGRDRPTPFDPRVYFNPTELSIPQYNLTLGYMFNSRFGVEIGEDHMKWVFDNQIPYQITGNFSPTLYASNSNPVNGWDGVRPMGFDEVKASGNATWLAFEHTNGYNYVFLSAVYRQPIFYSQNHQVGLDARFGAGGGVLIPQTSVHMHRDSAWNWAGYDNQFHLAGGGGHASTAIRLTLFENFFFQATARGSLIKVSNALVDQSGAILTQTPIAALELMGQIGYQGHLKRRKKR